MRIKTLLISPCSISNPKLDEALTVLIGSLPLLTALTFLSINAIDNATIFGTLLQAFYSSSIMRTLQRLNLMGHVGTFAALMENSPHERSFESLMELSLHLKDYQDTNRSIDDPNIHSLTRFFLSLGPTLQLLKIDNTSMFNLSPLFNTLSQQGSPAFFPNLNSFFLATEAVEPYALHRFLLPHYINLQHFQLKVNDPEAMDAWLNEFANSDSQVRSLQTLKIFISTQAGAFALRALIKRTSSTLSSLVIIGQYFWTHEEATQMIYALAPAEATQMDLRSLQISIAHLSVPFLDLLAGKIPQLEKLVLCIDQVVGSNEVCLLSSHFHFS